MLLRRDFRVLERYRYTIAAVGLAAAGAAARAGHRPAGQRRLPGRRLGPITFQPAEFAKIAIVIFLAAYLRDTRQVLVSGSRRFLGMTFPPLKHFGPLLVVWGGAMLMLDLHPRPRLVADVLRRLPGGALRGHEPCLVRARRAGAVRARRLVLRLARSATCRTASTSGTTRSRRRVVRPAAATRSRSRCSRRPTAGCSAPASARRCSSTPAGDGRSCRRRTPT